MKPHRRARRRRTVDTGLAVCLNPQVEHWALDVARLDDVPGLIAERYGGAGEVADFFVRDRPVMRGAVEETQGNSFRRACGLYKIEALVPQ